MARARFAEILRLLAAGDVEFVVVGIAAGPRSAISIASARSTRTGGTSTFWA
jgi:hypothetical protein